MRLKPISGKLRTSVLEVIREGPACGMRTGQIAQIMGRNIDTIRNAARWLILVGFVSKFGTGNSTRLIDKARESQCEKAERERQIGEIMSSVGCPRARAELICEQRIRKARREVTRARSSVRFDAEEPPEQRMVSAAVTSAPVGLVASVFDYAQRFAQ